MNINIKINKKKKTKKQLYAEQVAIRKKQRAQKKLLKKKEKAKKKKEKKKAQQKKRKAKLKEQNKKKKAREKKRKAKLKKKKLLQEKKKKEKAAQQELKRQMRLLQLGTTGSFNVDFSTLNRNAVLDFINENMFDGNIIVEANDTFITLNSNNYGEMEDILENIETWDLESGINTSMEQFVRELIAIGEITIYNKDEGLEASRNVSQESNATPAFIDDPDEPMMNFNTQKKKKKRNGGEFFKYTHKFNYDLKRYGVYTQQELKVADFVDNCLIKALTQGGMSEEKLEYLKLSCNSRNVPLCKLKEVAEMLKVCFTINTDRNRNKAIYGEEYDEVYNIGVLDQHYFINEKIPITRFYLNNYEELKDDENATQYFRKENGYYKSTTTRDLWSYEVVKFLLDNKTTLLDKITSYAEIYKTIHFDKVEQSFKVLKYDEELCVKKFNKKERIEKFKEKAEKQAIREDIFGVKQKVFFDFESCFKEVEEKDKIVIKHIPYLVCCRYANKKGIWVNKTFYGENCGEKFLESLEKDTLLIAHNVGYDFRFIVKHLFGLKIIEKGTSLMCATCKIYNRKNKLINLTIKDSYKLITMPLRDFGKCFSLDQDKDLMPYDTYTYNNMKKQFIPLQECLKSIHINTTEQEEHFNSNCKKWSCYKKINDIKCVDIIKYSKKYCIIDCKVLQEGYEKFRSWNMKKPFCIDIDNVVTISSLAHQFMVNEGVYDNVGMLSGVPRAFIQNCLVGGRCMSRDNEKWRIKGKIRDFDAVSLYPSAMVRLGGYLQGSPKELKILNYDFLSKCDGYFVKIKINKIATDLHFPLMSKISELGVRQFENKVGEYYVDKITLEDLIEYHQIDFDVLQGYYYDEGRNYTINEVMNTCFNERLKMKKVGNPIQLVYKLIMNSCYGKTIMKPHKVECRILDSTEKMKDFVSYNFNLIKEFTKIAGCDKWKVKIHQPISEHFTYNCVGIEVLSMSKRIMNEVIATAEQNDLKIYYQDTDSIHIEETDLKPLIKIYEKKYNRTLVGKKLGQFHSDFELEGCDDPYSEECIILGKKCYIDKLVGFDKDNNKIIDYHLRMKGVPDKSITNSATKFNEGNYIDLYMDLYNGKKVEFDLLCKDEQGISHRNQFTFNKDYTINTAQKFIRELCF
tara:strand:+ start:95 stop:3511 length:3417 start_codon:yes stop_codon:yes gene_type:complete